MAPKRRKGPPSRGRKILYALVAAILFAGGVYLGIALTKPPPPPDFSALTDDPAKDGGLVQGDEEDRTVDDSDASRTASRADSRDRGQDRGQDGRSDGGPNAVADQAQSDLEIRRQRAPGEGGTPKIAIVFDDLGRSVRDVERLESLGIPLTYAVLPFETRTAEVVAALRGRGAEYLCHLPMEAKGGADPGPGALRTSMDESALRAATRKALEAVPGAAGVNNHMGSAVAADARAMSAILDEVRSRDLYFLDSRTSADTVAYSLARELGVPAAERQVFLDTQKDADWVRRQFQLLVQRAKERGAILAIAHPYDETLQVLAEGIPGARAEGVEFVHASALLDS